MRVVSSLKTSLVTELEALTGFAMNCSKLRWVCGYAPGYAVIGACLGPGPWAWDLRDAGVAIARAAIGDDVWNIGRGAPRDPGGSSGYPLFVDLPLYMTLGFAILYPEAVLIGPWWDEWGPSAGIVCFVTIGGADLILGYGPDPDAEAEAEAEADPAPLPCDFSDSGFGILFLLSDLDEEAFIEREVDVSGVETCS